ncbi:MAG: hypothetical protein ACRDKA_01730 [Actinomycetota bacterium]
MTTKVEYTDEEPNGLASMIGGLIEANVASHPERARFLGPPAVVGILARDADVACTVRLAPDRVTVANGLTGSRAVIVRADTETLTDLTTVPLRMGFPDAMTAAGRAVTAKLLRGELRVRGLLRHPAVVSRLNRLLSVA